jgi:hypothetical protein
LAIALTEVGDRPPEAIALAKALGGLGAIAPWTDGTGGMAIAKYQFLLAIC